MPQTKKSPVVKNCLHCQAAFTERPRLSKERQARGGQTYCSKPCYDASRAVHLASEVCLECGRPLEASSLTGGRTKLCVGQKYCSHRCYHDSRILDFSKSCVICEGPFVRAAEQTANNYRRKRTCSADCAAKYRSIIGRYGSVGMSRSLVAVAPFLSGRECSVCGAAFDRREKEPLHQYNKRKTCSPECNGVWLRTTRKRDTTPITMKPCESCGVPFAAIHGHVDKKKRAAGGKRFCSPPCYHKWQETLIGDLAINWAGGISFEPYPVDFSRELRRFIRRRDEFRCQLCGIDQDMCQRSLCVHHIDYEKVNCAPVNLIALCSSCHVRTNHRRDYWRGLLYSRMEARCLV